MTTIALPRPRNVLLDRLRTIQIGVAARSAVGVGLATQRGGTAALPWYRASGAPRPVAVYQPKGAESLATSKINVDNPGVHDAVQGSATQNWDAVNGWRGGGNGYLKTGVVPVNNQTWSVLIRFSNVYELTEIAGVLGDTSENARLTFAPSFYGGVHSVYSGGYKPASGMLTEGVLAIAGNAMYTNGVQEAGTIPAGSGVAFVNDIYILTRNWQNSPSGFFNGNVQAFAAWDTSTNHAAWMPAVMAAVSLI